jgi:hypothetical protein
MDHFLPIDILLRLRLLLLFRLLVLRVLFLYLLLRDSRIFKPAQPKVCG